MAVLTTSKLRVKPFYIRFIFDRFYKSMLHLEVYTFSFTKLLTWMKGRFNWIWKTWKANEVDWVPSLSILNVLPQATTSLLAQGKKEFKSNTLWKLNSDYSSHNLRYWWPDYNYPRMFHLSDRYTNSSGCSRSCITRPTKTLGYSYEQSKNKYTSIELPIR
jgi:hypothetical protein